MRIKHTSTETYRIYSLLAVNSCCRAEKRWYLVKHCNTKRIALNCIKRYKNNISNDLIFKIVWCPYPLADKEKCITVYSEENEVNYNEK